ncbi:putative transporter YycB [Paenibacillus sp. CECT 9249]|uniref:CynX/NimT family MFS transporter n=1 Tax=Paenibacillus sp. CECT 9249 TaxID=2845385 RepID=UPI001E48F110|nr:MFS transporter [Paenibacillus sp. CECT 9249]CAH0118533.1 putative transporter YycB [Paenibacillus sp. CECT 9249]
MKSNQGIATMKQQEQVSPIARTGIWLFIGILLIASTLRAPITVLGPIVGDIRDDTDISNTLAGMLTTLPLLAFALVSPLAPRMARRIGTNRSLLIGLAVLTAGIALRSIPSVPALFAGTALLGMAIAVSNVLLPSLIKRDYPAKVGLMTGLYSVVMNMWAAVASGVSIPVAQGMGLGWRGTLAIWAVLSLIALAVWLPQVRRDRGQALSQAAGAPAGKLWSSSLAWQVTLFMGLQSFLFYVNIAWIPEILVSRGMSHASAGWMLSIMQFVSLPSTFIMPVLAGRSSNQRGLVVTIAALFLIGYAGLLWGGNTLALLWIIMIGIAGGAGFSLAVMFFALRAHHASQAAELSGMAQSVGYLLAAVGPTVFGFMHDATHAWTVPLIMLIVIAFLLLAAGFGAGRNAYVDAPTVKFKHAFSKDTCKH